MYYTAKEVCIAFLLNSCGSLHSLSSELGQAYSLRNGVSMLNIFRCPIWAYLARACAQIWNTDRGRVFPFIRMLLNSPLVACPDARKDVRMCFKHTHACNTHMPTCICVYTQTLVVRNIPAKHTHAGSALHTS